MEANGDCLEETDTTDSKDKSAFLPKDEDSLDFDLYGDLSVDLNQEMTYPELKKLYEESQQKIKNLEAERENGCKSLSEPPVSTWNFESQKLKDENLVLKKNISSLYLTAREEIKRKDAQIKTLQDREVRSRRKFAASQQ